jgi:hypothetical protein
VKNIGVWRGPRSARAALTRCIPATDPRPWRPRGSRPRSLALTLALLVLAGCGRTAEPPADTRFPMLSPRGPLCAPDPYPQVLPAVDAVVDSARVARAVRVLVEADPARAGYVLLTVEFDRSGFLYHRDVLEHSTPRAVADSVWRLVDSARREAAESDTEWGVRLRVDVASPARLAIGRREFCRPVPRNPELYRAIQSYSPPGVRVRPRERVQLRTVHVRAYVDDLGTVTAANIVRGDLSGGELERHIFRFLQQFLFQPATIDGEPTGAWVELPVIVRMPA